MLDDKATTFWYLNMYSWIIPIIILHWCDTVMILSFRTDMPGQTVQTQIRLLLESSLIRVYTVCHSSCIVWTHYSMVEPHSSNFRVITTNILGVRILRKFTVIVIHSLHEPSTHSIRISCTCGMVTNKLSKTSTNMVLTKQSKFCELRKVNQVSIRMSIKTDKLPHSLLTSIKHWQKMVKQPKLQTDFKTVEDKMGQNVIYQWMKSKRMSQNSTMLRKVIWEGEGATRALCGSYQIPLRIQAK